MKRKRRKRMMWYEILMAVIGSVGGTAGIVGLYKAKSEKTTIDVGNMQTMLDEAHKMYEDSRKREDETRRELSDYKEQHKRENSELDGRITKLENRLGKTEVEVFELRGAVYQAYRCVYPPKTQDCPVIVQYEKNHCADCLALQETNK